MNSKRNAMKTEIAARIAILAGVDATDLTADVIADRIVVESTAAHAAKVAAVFGTPVEADDWCDDEYFVCPKSSATRAFVRIPFAAIERSIAALTALSA